MGDHVKKWQKFKNTCLTIDARNSGLNELSLFADDLLEIITNRGVCLIFENEPDFLYEEPGFLHFQFITEKVRPNIFKLYLFKKFNHARKDSSLKKLRSRHRRAVLA